MNTNGTTTKNVSITDRAMLIGLTITQWSATRNDKRVDKEVSDHHGSDQSMGRFNKSLIEKGALEKLKKIASAARAEHYARTLPWDNDGQRILLSAGYFEYNQKMHEHKMEFDSALSHFLQAYPRYVSDARSKLNGLFDITEYPATDKIASKFSFSTSVRPVPDAADFRVKMGNDEANRIRADIQEQVNETIGLAMADVWGRLKTVVQRMSDRLKAFQRTSDNKVENPFRDSLVGNISELLDLIPSLNLTNDPDLNRFAKEVRTYLTSYSAEELRDQDTARAKTADKAQEILKAMEDFI